MCRAGPPNFAPLTKTGKVKGEKGDQQPAWVLELALEALCEKFPDKLGREEQIDTLRAYLTQ